MVAFVIVITCHRTKRNTSNHIIIVVVLISRDTWQTQKFLNPGQLG